MKKLVLLLVLTVLLSACQDKTVYRTPSEEDIDAILDSATDEERFWLLDKVDVDFALSLTSEEYQNAWMWIDRSGTTIDEIVIITAKNDFADSVYQKLENYITHAKANKKDWLESYNAKEAAKLENGKLFRYGNTMGCVFLENDEQTDLLTSLNDFFS